MSNIKRITPGELHGMKFFIPDYQRGYRWTNQQVKDLIDDINDFSPKGEKDFYCLQPLVVTVNQLEGKCEVIDGQQRLTSLYILLCCLGEKDNLYSIEYETRKDSETFLKNIDDDRANDNIDYYHIVQAKKTIKDSIKNIKDKKEFADKILKDVCFIWYETDEDPVKVFTRLNIGKIPLTNAELIKALFLNKSNFGKEEHNVDLRQNEIASEWDNIEYTLHNEDFWNFIHKYQYNLHTRIDFIFDILVEKDYLNLIIKDKIGADKDKTFRYFYEYFKLNSKDENKDEDKVAIDKAWSEVKKVFYTFKEWYDDLEMYHYIGFLIECGTSTENLLDKWSMAENKDSFISYLKKEIREKIKGCKNLDQQYELGNCPKTTCKPLLLLHNIQTIINQAKESTKEYGAATFYKFPFRLYRIEKWDVEHIDSNTENSLSSVKDQIVWLKRSLIDQEISNELKESIVKWIEDTNNNNNENERNETFEKIQKEIIEIQPEDTRLTNEEKNQIKNFVLLDSNTNKSYKNFLFPVKRMIIIGRDQGKNIKIDEEGNMKENPGKYAFVPPCTKYAFLKYYNKDSASIRYWDKIDAEAYKENIKETLKEFLD